MKVRPRRLLARCCGEHLKAWPRAERWERSREQAGVTAPPPAGLWFDWIPMVVLLARYRPRSVEEEREAQGGQAAPKPQTQDWNPGLLCAGASGFSLKGR